MTKLRVLSLFLAVHAASETAGEDLLDRVDEALTFATPEGNIRARFSGILDLEAYHFSGPPPGVIDTHRSNLFVPRGTFFFDAQIGSTLYVFAQARVDRGFDPSDSVLQGRIEEYAVRYTPWDDGRLSVQVGRFGTVVGSWMERHLSWENPFINAPLPYEGITGASDFDLPGSRETFTAPSPSERYDYLPVIWGPSYATGISVAGKLGNCTYAAEIKNAALSSRPESWDVSDVGFDRPSFNGRLGYKPNAAWNFGISGSYGSFLRPEAEPDLPSGGGLRDYNQILLGNDVSFAWRHFQIWAEWYLSRFKIPRIGDADTFVYFVEAKYKLTPQLFVALRWNQQFFSNETIGADGLGRWGDDVDRLDVAVGYRFTPHTQLKLQYTVEKGAAGSSGISQMAAGQLTVKF